MKEKFCLDDYLLSNARSIDFLKIIELLNKGINDIEKIKKQTKPYFNSLFSPILSYIISYLNSNGEQKGVIGKGKIDEFEVVYTILNKRIYDLFFLRKKGKIYDGTIEIDYNINKNEDNYQLTKFKKDKELNINKLRDFIAEIIDEEKAKIDFENKNLIKELYQFKKKEVISAFKLGYSIQEKILNMFLEKVTDKVEELPNIIFYKRNNINDINDDNNNTHENILFQEVDRVVKVEKEVKVPYFLVYSRAEFRRNMKQYEIKTITNIQGEVLKLQSNSCNFLEVKTSMKYLFDKESNNDNNLIINTRSNLSSNILSGPNNINNKHEERKPKNIYKNIVTFKKLFDNIFSKEFKFINIIIIVDSIFPKNFFILSERFINNFNLVLKEKGLDFDFDLLFVHVESDITYIHELNEFEKFHINSEKLEKQMKKQKDEFEKKLEGHNKKVKKYEQEMEELKKQIEELNKKGELRKIKKKIQKENLASLYFENIIKKLNNINDPKETNLIIGNYSNDSFLNLEKLELEKSKYNIIIDFKTFCRLYYKEKYNKFINDINKKYNKYIMKFSKITFNSLILFVDFTFILSLKDFMIKIFTDKNVLIEPIIKSFFILYIQKDKSTEKKIIFNDSIPDFNYIDLNKIPNIINFVHYYFEIKKIKENIKEEYIKDYPLYDPISDGTYYDIYLTIKENQNISNDIAVILINPFIEYELLNLKIYENNYKYIIIIDSFFTYAINNSDDNNTNNDTKDTNDNNNNPLSIKNICEFFFGNKTFMCFPIPCKFNIIYEVKQIGIAEDEENKIWAICNEEKIFFKLKFNQIENSSKKIVDFTNLYDKKIILLFKIIQTSKNNENINILIQEPFNIIYNFLLNKYKKQISFY